ncbi:MAG: DUF5682 family protein [Saprospiraceae bacterium]
METEIKIFGIRHHGAGSARRLFQALQNFEPEIICVEMPYESNQIIHQLKTNAHECPLALMFYNRDKPDQMMYYPFAEFSPEYQAMKYSFEKNIVLHAFDLPAGLSLIPSNFKKNTEQSLTYNQKNIVNDPLGYLAKKSGYQDTERWWDAYFESWTEGEDLFEIINSLMLELRLNSDGLDDYETLVREEFMRTELRSLLKQNPKKLAIVCGAWHAPALCIPSSIPIVKMDLKNLQTVPINVNIIPWSYSRLALDKYYSAGVESPVWSQFIFKNPNLAISSWLSYASQQMRKNGFQISTAELIDCERLATELANLREMPIAGIEELLDACIAVIGKGDEKRIQLIKNEIVIGNKSGSLEINNESLPLIKEFQQKLKSLGLKKYWSAESKEKIELDLRKIKHLEISHFLHQAVLLKLDWCFPKSIENKTLGNFHEHWSFDWSIAQEISLAHTAIKGISIEDVIHEYIQEELEASNDFNALALSLEHGLKANLIHLWPKLLDKINILSIHSEDIESLCMLIKPLISSITYGNVHKMDTQVIESIIQRIIPKIILKFGDQCSNIKEDKAKRMLSCLNLLFTFFLHSEDKSYNDLLKTELIIISTNEIVHPIIRGKVWNDLLNERWIGEEQFVTELNYQFRSQTDAQKTAFWMEGFLYQTNNFYLFQDQPLFLINEWLITLDEDNFRGILPLLRRSFSELNTSERRRIISRLSRHEQVDSENKIITLLDPERLGLLEAFDQFLS